MIFVSHKADNFLSSVAALGQRVKDGTVRVCVVREDGYRSVVVYARANFGSNAIELRYSVSKERADAARSALETRLKQLGLEVRPRRVERWMVGWFAQLGLKRRVPPQATAKKSARKGSRSPGDGR